VSCARARSCARRSDRPSAAPQHGRSVQSRHAIHMATICLWSQRNFFNALSHRHSLPQAAAIEPGYFGPVAAPPRSLCAQVRPAAAARGQNARKSCLTCLSNLFCRWINFRPRPGRVFVDCSQMPPKRRLPEHPEDAPQIAFSTRSGPFHYTRQVLQAHNMKLNAIQIGTFMNKFESKELNDKFLPFWSVTGLKNRIGFTSLQANLFLLEVQSLQKAKVVPAEKDLQVATEEDFDEVVAAVLLLDKARGNMQRCIDDHLRKRGVWCNPTTVSRRLKGSLPGKRSRILSPDSIAMITDMMYCATASTNCKPAGTLRRLARACAMLEKRYSSYQAYLTRNRTVPVIVEGTRSRAGIPLMYDSQSDSNPRHPSHSQRMSQQADTGVVVSSQSQTGPVLLPAQHADVGEGLLSSDFGGGGNAAVDSGEDGDDDDDDSTTSSAKSDRGLVDVESDGSGSSSSGDEHDNQDLSDDDEPHAQLDPLPWRGVAPSNQTEFHKSNKLSMRYPRKSQTKKLMKECNCSVNVAQWIAKHRR
jgi:hypothetical protein